MSNLEQIKGTIQKMGPQFQKALPKHINSEKFTRVVTTAIANNASLADCNKQSLLGSCMKLAEMGLMPDGKEAAIVKFGQQAQAMPMVAGLLKLVRNSGELISLSANAVYENDEFEYWVDEDGEHLKHKPLLSGDRGEVTHVYALAKTRDGGLYIELMSKQEIDKIRNASRSKDGGPWKTWYDQMAIKSVIRRLYKRLPSSTDLDTAMYADDNMYDLDPAPTPTEPPKDLTPGPSKLKAAMEAEEPDGEEVDDEELPI